MSEWSQLSGKFHGKDEVEALLERGARGREAIGLWCWAKSVCTLHHETRGTIRAGKIRGAGWSTHVAGLLVEVGLWAETDGGYVFADWTEHAESPEEVESRREAARERQARSRESRRMSQRDSECDSHGESRVSHFAEEKRGEERREDPTPPHAGARTREAPPPEVAAVVAALGAHPDLAAVHGDAEFAAALLGAASTAGREPLLPKAIGEAAHRVLAEESRGSPARVRETLLRFARQARPERAATPRGRAGPVPQPGPINFVVGDKRPPPDPDAPLPEI